MKKLYNFKVLNVLQVFVDIVCEYKSHKAYKELVYPLSELIGALCCLYPATEYYPLFLKYISLINKIIKGTGVFIPLYSKFKALLNNKMLYKKYELKKAKEFDFELSIKATKDRYSNNKYWDDFLIKLSHLIIENLSYCVTSPSFDSFALKMAKLLKTFYKRRNSMERKQVLKRIVN